MTPSLQKPVMYHKYSNDPNLTDKVKKSEKCQTH